jgi:cytochrome c-type biogenesis protein CcmE
LKVAASIVVVGGALGALLYSSAVPGMEYYKYVDEVMVNREQLRDKRLKVHGYVVEGSILKRPDALDYRFKLETRAPRAPAVIEADYRGLVPDNFKSGAEVVAKGTLTSENRLVVVKDGIEAKCPSKYEAGAPKLNPKPGSAAPMPSTDRLSRTVRER